ncbi:MAG: hypothetical protein IB617_03150 [Candidatus Nealsonbacteria bacterium]|nr:MAG: hypothetical protein IB617_03150 [Candidatus Nealsonbacteria bacterium]
MKKDKIETKKLKPAIFEGPCGWGWVNLQELAEIIGKNPEDIWYSFFGLTKDIEYGILSWSLDLEEMIQDEEREPTRQEFKKLYVPAGWAMDVLRAVELGTEHIELIHHPHLKESDECPLGTLNCSFCGCDFVAAVGIKEDGSPIEDD